MLPTFYPHSNPPLKYIRSSIKEHPGHTLKDAYEGKSYFWGSKPKVGDTIEFWFAKPTNVIRSVYYTWFFFYTYKCWFLLLPSLIASFGLRSPPSSATRSTVLGSQVWQFVLFRFFVMLENQVEGGSPMLLVCSGKFRAKFTTWTASCLLICLHLHHNFKRFTVILSMRTNFKSAPAFLLFQQN